MLEPNDYNEIDFYIYQQFIEKLIYLMYKTKPDITFVVGQISRHNSNPRKKRLRVAKRVVRYLKRIMQMELIFG